MIQVCQPLGHAIIVGIFRLECELEEAAGDRRSQISGIPAYTAIGPNLPKSRTAVADQTQAEVVAVCTVVTRRAEDRSDEVVIEIRGSNTELALFQSQNTVVVPRRLAEGRERNCVLTTYSRIGVARLINVGEKFRTEQSFWWRNRFEHHGLADYFAAIRSHDFCRRNLAGFLAHVKIGSTIYIDTAFREVYAALGVEREAREEFVTNPDHLVGLLEQVGHLPSDSDVLTVAEHPSKRVTGERSGGGLVPRHNRSCIQPAG